MGEVPLEGANGSTAAWTEERAVERLLSPGGGAAIGSLQGYLANKKNPTPLGLP